jgi:hypothetical protein
MSLLKFNQHPYHSGRGASTATGNYRSSSTHGGRQHTVANMGGGQGGGYRGGGANIDMYNPIYDRLDEGSIIEDWIPRDAAGLNQMFSLMYHRDPIAGSVVDIVSDLIWDEFDLTGVDDPEIKKVYLDSMTNMNILGALPALTKEFLVLGRSITSMIFDSKRGVFTDLISHDQSFVRITPIPILGYDPKLDLIPSPGLKKFLESTDPRDLDAKQAIPASYVQAMSQGATEGVPLDPISTLFMPRRVFNYDYIGTSLYTRLISFWALEKALINATMSAARRRASPILHVKVGIDNVWRPTDGELSEIAGLFLSADQDPVGAVVTTRNGVDTQEIKSGTDLWKWSDEWQMLTEGKMRALGANDSLLSGEATYTNQEAARSFLMEKASALRDVITNRLFYKKLFPLIARLHGFVKDKSAIKSGVKPTQREILSIPESDLIMPTIRWRKDLVSNGNQAKLDILDKMEEKGVPITIKNWAAAGGINLQDQMSEMEIDADIRKRISEWRKDHTAEDFNPAAEAQRKFIDSLRATATAGIKKQLVGLKNEMGALNRYPFWAKNGTFAGITAKEVNKVVSQIDPSSNKPRVLLDALAIKNWLVSEYKDPDKAAIAHYLLFRTGLTPLAPALEKNQIEAISKSVDEVATSYVTQGASALQMTEIVNTELKTIRSCDNSLKKQSHDRLMETLSKIHVPADGIRTTASSLYSGF